MSRVLLPSRVRICGHDRFDVRKRLEDLRVDQASGRIDLAIDAVERRKLAFWSATDEAPGATNPEIDFTDGHGVAVVEASPPPSDMLGLRHRLEHEIAETHRRAA